MDNTFIEQDCKFEFQDKSFESGGSWICKCTDGIYRGGVYIKYGKLPLRKWSSNHSVKYHQEEFTATTWHGKLIAYLDTCTEYRGNFCKMQRISFTWKGIKFIGDYCPDWSEYCKVRSTKKYL